MYHYVDISIVSVFYSELLESKIISFKTSLYSFKDSGFILIIDLIF